MLPQFSPTLFVLIAVKINPLATYAEAFFASNSPRHLFGTVILAKQSFDDLPLPESNFTGILAFVRPLGQGLLMGLLWSPSSLSPISLKLSANGGFMDIQRSGNLDLRRTAL